MKVKALRREKIMGGKAEVLTPAEVDVNIRDVLMNDIYSFKYEDYEKFHASSLTGREIVLGEITYLDRGKRKTVKKGGIAFKKLSDFIEFLSTIYIPEKAYPIDEFILDIRRKMKNQKKIRMKIQNELVNSLSDFSLHKSLLGPFYIIKEQEASGTITMSMLGQDSYETRMIELSPFRNFVFLGRAFLRTEEPLIALRKYTLEVNGKQVPYSKFLVKASYIGENVLIWDSHTFKIMNIYNQDAYLNPHLDEDIEDINSQGKIYHSWFFEYLPLPQAEVKFIARVPSSDEVKKLRIDIKGTTQKTPPVKDTVYMVDALSALTPKQLSSAKVVIDDPEDALKIWARTFSKIFVPDDIPFSSVPLPEEELYIAGVII